MKDYDEQIFKIWLSKINGIGPAKQKALYKHFKHASDIYEASVAQLIKTPQIGSVLAGRIVKARDLDDAKRLIDKCEKGGIGITCFGDGDYPSRLLECSDIPNVLFYIGKLKEMDKSAGVVGPRRCDREMRDITIEQTTSLLDNGYNIVSGMALGVDGYAHTVAIKSDAYTVAVLGCGVDICYPKEHIDLYECIKTTGLVLSAYEPGVHAETFSFPERNKIIAALSDELYVICPGRRSGSLLTAKYASDYGRTVIRK